MSNPMNEPSRRSTRIHRAASVGASSSLPEASDLSPRPAEVAIEPSEPLPETSVPVQGPANQTLDTTPTIPSGSTTDATLARKVDTLAMLVQQLVEQQQLFGHHSPTARVAATEVRSSAGPEQEYHRDITPDDIPTTTDDLSDIPCERPEHFEGASSSISPFIAQVTVYTELQQRKFRTDIQKVLFAGSCFRKDAAKWWAVQLGMRPRPPWFYSWNLFIDTLHSFFGKGDRKVAAADAIDRLRQTDSVASYLSKFLSLRVELDWNESAVCFAFKKGLKEEIRRGLVYVRPQPRSFQHLTEVALDFDRQLFAERRTSERNDRSEGHKQSSKRRDTAHHRSERPSQNQATPSRTEATSKKPVRGPLSDAEKQRRFKNGLCLVCGSDKHLRSECPSSRFPARPSVNAVDTSEPGNEAPLALARETKRNN